MQVSKHGNEESDGNKHESSGIVKKPHDTSGIPDSAHGDTLPVGASPFQYGSDFDAAKIKDNLTRKHSASPQRRTTRTSGNHERSTEHSPLHHHHQARVANKVGGFSPSWEKKGSSEGGHGAAPSTAGRSRLRVGGRADESPDDSSAVPGIGQWDESNPSAADSFTGIFEKVREEKQTSATKVPMITDDRNYINSYYPGNGSNDPTGCFCFKWGKK
ncbi:RPM1-interacting protein 4 [Apostasia shenzhenica]|uniref:RPM1-interacting protein 4 n=1 Tax=Apostasia shenzhenica TaxID=1088818 RepID=A0A2H9ZVY3_9ASPA|nr:RPM1-interacting protein 4 [Apostasia shenzhenica]